MYHFTFAAVCIGAASWVLPAHAASYDPGASDKEVRIGQTAPMSGPIAFVGITISKIGQGYWKEVNERGGINGRKVTMLTRDDGYSPPKAIEATRKLVEEDMVLADFGSVGTPTNVAKLRYLNSKKVPHLLVLSGSTRFQDANAAPWTVGLFPSYVLEGTVYARHVLQTKPNAKIAVLYQNDDVGKDYLEGLRRGLGARAATMMVKVASYEPTDPSIDAQIVALAGSGADVFVNIASGKFASQAIRKSAEINWKPTQYMLNSFSSVKSVLESAGLENAKGVMTAFAFKEPSDPTWANDPGVKDYLANMKRWAPDVNPYDFTAVSTVAMLQLTEAVLRRTGDVVTRENLRKQTLSLKDHTLPLLLPGISLSLSEQNYSGFTRLQLGRFNGERWELFGNPVSGD
ncbi:ABC transporter substrate-binding protein [Variovorax sp. GB1P17]|uniref:ABC transporter substrate-binding protein n=1 Tax=Variovorax sp. GB1P17 TaxID=3443740 RepID=UPI003F45EF10